MTGDATHRTRIKICGLRSAEHVDAALDAGAYAVGFVLYPPSPRAVTIDECASLAARVPAMATTVALFVNPTRTEVEAALHGARIDLLQFHGSESESFCAGFGRPYMKALAVAAGFDLLESAQHYRTAAALLLDTPSASHGGSGQTFDWTLIPCHEPITTTSTPDVHAPRVVLSGGLTAANVATAIDAVRPWAVDVSSGVEVTRGVKSSMLIRSFCDAVRDADRRR